ncbi:MAG TPA: G8 domain-containing protein [Bryobacteraceae bacterium]|nr:G8 domain-containing protein [Bryobacteraceae bacterium]
MRKHSLLSLSLLLPAFWVLGGHAVGQAQQKTSSAAGAKRWSDAATWPDRKVPAKDDVVTIEKDMDVVLDVSPPPLHGLRINGKLSFADKKDLELTTEWILLHGELEIGTEARPHTRNATITLTNEVPGEDIESMGDRGIMVMGGTLNLHGTQKNSWTRLTKTAAAGSNSIEVANASGWKKGDAIVVASTDFDPHQAERRTIASVSGNVIHLDQQLEYMHYGEVTFGVDERGEVGMLTRNIRIQASADAEKSFSGGHVMAMVGSTMKVSGVEFFRMGQHENLARYPIHWHLVGDAPGQYIENSAIHDTYSRCVTVHGTNDVRVKNNVAYNNVGHCYFLEDGVEHGNQYLNNLGMLTRCNPTRPCRATNALNGSPAGQNDTDQLIPSDNTASTFWITNPDNTYRGNVSAGSEETGFWIALPEHPTGKFEGTEISAKTWPRRMQLKEFSGNVAHSDVDGLMFDRGPNAQGKFNLGGNTHLPYSDPSDTNSARLETVIQDFTSYKNGGAAIWARGENHVFKGLKLADSGIGYTHAYPGVAPYHGDYTSKVEDSLFVGETGNKGTPKTEAEIAYGRSMPRQDADYPIRGFEYYDFTHHVINTKFVNFVDNATRKTGAISYLLYTSFPISTNNDVEGLKFENAKPVYFPPTEDPRWSFSGEFGRFGGWNGAVFHDIDGSVGGVANSYIVIDNGIADDPQHCQIKPDWNAAVCKGDFGRLGVGAPARGGGFGAGFGAGGPGAPGRPAVAGGPTASGGPGAAAARGGFGGGGGFFAGPQVTLSRNGRKLSVSGDTTVLAGTEIRAESEAPSLNLTVRELDKGSWVIVELPGYTSATTGAAQTSLDALRGASDTSYYKGDGSLWVKLVSDGGGARPGRGGGTGASIQVSR